MMSFLHHPHVMQTMLTWCCYNANSNEVMPPHLNMAQIEHELWKCHGDMVHIIWEPCDITMGMHVMCMCAWCMCYN